MTILDAIEKRTSRRGYLKTPIDGKNVEILQTKLAQLNNESGLHMQLVLDGQEAFRGIRRSYGMFSGVQSYFAMVGKKSDVNLREKLGFYGELLVLEETMQGLGTCWVVASYGKNDVACDIAPDEELCAVIPVGNVKAERGMKEKALYSLAHRKTKTPQEMYTADSEVPSWFLSGMEAVCKAPSAINKQPVEFQYKSGIASASVADSASYERIDMGIAKLHFQLGAGGGSWEWGNGGNYTRPGDKA